MDETVKKLTEPTWRKSPRQLIGTYLGMRTFVDRVMDPDTVQLVDPKTGKILSEIKVTR